MRTTIQISLKKKKSIIVEYLRVRDVELFACLALIFAFAAAGTFPGMMQLQPRGVHYNILEKNRAVHYVLLMTKESAVASRMVR